jgi:uncharacterized membrane protein
MGSPTSAYNATQVPLRVQILREAEEMAEYAFASGKRVPPSIAQVVHQARLDTPRDPAAPPPDDVRHLAVAHEQLSKIVAPATPRALVLLDEERDNAFAFLGPVGFVRRMVLVAAICTVAFIIVSISPEINIVPGQPDPGDIMRSDGLKLFINELFFLTAAGMGASFHALVDVKTYINRRNFDPRFEASYWIKFLLGLIAGLMMVTLIPVNPESGHGFARPTLAMLGGFSAAAVYRIILRLVDTMESLVQGDAKEMLESRERAAKAKAEEEVVQHRMKMTSDLVALQQQLASGAGSDEVREQLNRMVGGLTGANDSIQLDGAAARPTVSLPNMPIVGPQGQVQAPTSPAPSAPASDVASPNGGDDEPRAVGQVPDAEDMSDGEADVPAPAAPPVQAAVVSAEEAVG